MIRAALFLLFAIPLVSCSSEAQREALLFNQADRDQDGELTESDLSTIFLDFDIDHDGNVTQEEFRTDWVTVFHLGNAEEAKTLFGRADTNDDGVITDADLPDIFNYFDMDGNGLVDMNEFLTQWGDLELNVPDTIFITTSLP